MKEFLIKWFINIVALVLVMHITQGISVDTWQAVVFAALALGMVNAFLRPLVILFTLPLNILSLGLFTLVINGFLFYLVSKLIRGFIIVGFWNAFWGSLLFSAISFILNLFIGTQGSAKARFYGQRHPQNPNHNNVIDIEGKPEEKEE